MLRELTQPRQRQLNTNALYSSEDVTRTQQRQAEWLPIAAQPIHAHVHEYKAVTPKHTIELDKTAKVQVKWSMYGDVTPYLAGTWRVSAFLEAVQASERIPLTLGEAIPLTPQLDPVDYATWVTIPAHTVTLHADAPTKAYKLVVTVTYEALNGQPAPTFPACFVLVTTLTYREPATVAVAQTGCVEGPELQFYIVA
ncbi:MAG: hypothetical protein WCP31_10335 [Chloroflexales bacterium]